jgi:hypothetical protein
MNIFSRKHLTKVEKNISFPVRHLKFYFAEKKENCPAKVFVCSCYIITYLIIFLVFSLDKIQLK